MPDEEIEKELSYAYLFAVAAIAGFTINFDRQDYGIDGSFKVLNRLPNRQVICSTHHLNFQVKSSILCSIDEQAKLVKYRMKSDAFNRLVEMNGDTYSPCILILFRLPKDKDMWASFSDDIMTLRHCCYWEVIKGTTVQPNSTKTIYIPQRQIFTPDSLVELYSAHMPGRL